MLDLEKIIYIKDLRNGRYITIFFAFMLFILNNYFKTYIFFSMLILFPKSFLNLIWSYNDEFVFFFFYSKEKISNVILANKTITISELNIVFFISALFFLDSFQLIRIVELNIFVLFYFTLSDFLFYVNFRTY